MNEFTKIETFDSIKIKDADDEKIILKIRGNNGRFTTKSGRYNNNNR